MKQGKVFAEIRKIVARIPEEKVATYGQVAKLMGINDARVIGWALWGNQDPKIPFAIGWLKPVVFWPLTTPLKDGKEKRKGLKKKELILLRKIG